MASRHLCECGGPCQSRAAGRTGAERGRDVRVSISINAPAGSEARALAGSSRQVARAVKAALLRVED